MDQELFCGVQLRSLAADGAQAGVDCVPTPLLASMQYLTDFCQAQPHALAVLHYQQALNMLVGVNPVTRGGAVRDDHALVFPVT